MGSAVVDRTVHAVTDGGVEVVRYEAAGRWYAERHGRRTRLSLRQAVDLACAPGSHVYYGRAGGGMFDRQARA